MTISNVHRACLPKRGASSSLLAAACFLVAGCASPPPPSGFDFKGAAIVRAPEAAKVDLTDVSERSAGKGAGGGAAAGAVTGSIACVPALFLYPACVAMMAAAGAGIGASAGSVVGKAVLDSPETLAQRRKGLNTEMASTARQALLATELQTRLREDFAHDLAIIESPALIAAAGGVTVSNTPTWQVEVGLSEIGVLGGVHRFGVRMPDA